MNSVQFTINTSQCTLPTVKCALFTWHMVASIQLYCWALWPSLQSNRTLLSIVTAGSVYTFTLVYCTILQYTALHSTALHCTALHCTALHYTLYHCDFKILDSFLGFGFLSWWTSLLCIVGELAGAWSMAVAVGHGDMWQVTCDMWHMICDTWHVTRDSWKLRTDTN